MHLDDTGQPLSAEVTDPFGEPLDTWSALPAPWLDTRDETGLHGMPRDTVAGLTRMGVRHMRLGDGLWLQPEPLLALGMADQTSVAGAFGVYAAADPLGKADRSGYADSPQSGERALFEQALDTLGLSDDAEALVRRADAFGQWMRGSGHFEQVEKTAGVYTWLTKTLFEGAENDYMMGVMAWLSRGGMANDAANGLQDFAFGSCFVEDTLVRTPSGPTPIQHLTPDDKVIAADVDGAPPPAPFARPAPTGAAHPT